ncbi:hypothetical protein NDU88_006604 [Pleurodeles waltl]|uniref:Uncharacterized protein n=1 Tax=Pleurodeles waltl TaxID=8319 RepID=A0AAV7PRT4_PLEWA|nr:hypothetical protein NDU88_006604 [Pleurodeles waltl]
MWEYSCWRDSGGFVITSLSLTFGVADLGGCLDFGGFRAASRNSWSGILPPQRCAGGLLHGVAQRSPTSPENNLGGRAMPVIVPWNQAGLCTKDFCRKCTEAGAAAKVVVPSNAV